MNYTLSQLIIMPLMFVAVLLTSLVLGKLLKNKPEKIRRIPVVVVTTFLLLFEVVKQMYNIVNNSWTTWALPLHFCSALMIWYAIASYSKEGSFARELGYATSFAGSLLMTICFYFYPTGIFGNACDNPFSSFSTFHSFTFHFLAISIWMLILTLKLYTPSKKAIWGSVVAYSIYMGATIALAYLFNTNYANALYSNLSVLENIRVTYGQVPYLLILAIFCLVSVWGILSIFRAIVNRKAKKVAKN